MDDERFIEGLRARFNAGEKLKYVFFWGHQPSQEGVTSSCLSQWYEASFEVEGRRYPTAEHFMMAEKAALFHDEEIRALVFAAPNPGAAKALGRKVRGFDGAVWRQHRFAIVVGANHAKFAQNPPLQDFLIKTGSRILVEASPVDPVWGTGLSKDDPAAADPNRWRGLNLLGFALMQVRANADA
jgi:ribA/ribD-fused uncharacterized protein